MAFEFDKEELKTFLKEVIAEAAHPLSDDEIKWVRLAIEAEAKKAAFRQAVIDKTLIGLLSSGVIGLIYFCIDTFKNHWK
jgi:F0F1-type ATP synthase delta subunit